MMRSPLARCETVNTRRLRRRGLGGLSVTVTVSAEVLSFAGSEGGVLDVPLSALARVRAGFEEYRHGPSLSVQLWLRDGSPRLRLHEWHDTAAYAHFVRTFAVILLRTPGATIVETGSGWFVPLLVFGLFEALALAGLVGAVLAAARGGDWTPPALAACAGAAVVLALRRWVLACYVPRRVHRPADIERAFPPQRAR